ncbi:MAG: hypothetical protein M9894_31265 [Planctomycetes bacterium]|nr:hypothetical protein [Planctomycetota bacterium]
MGQVKLNEVAQAFGRWRAEKVGNEPLPESLWAQAVEAAREHGTTKTARLLRLNHSALKRRGDHEAGREEAAGA